MAAPTVARTSRSGLVAALATATLLLLARSAGAAPGAVAVNLKRVGASDLGRPGIYGDVTVVGTTAVVATEGPPAPGSACPSSTAQVVDVKRPRTPAVVASIPLPPGLTAALDSLSVDGPAFTGDLLAVALTPRAGCGASGRLAYYDLTDPAHPAPLAETAGDGYTSVSLARQGDGRVLAAGGGPTGVDIVDVTDPAHPAPLGRWTDGHDDGAVCTGSVRLGDGGGEAVVVRADGRIYDLDLTDPVRPAGGGPTEGGAGGPRFSHTAVLPLGNRTIAIVTEAECQADAAGNGRLRVLTTGRGTPPSEDPPVAYPGAGAPGRLVASGGLAYVAWHGAGVRVVDFGQVRPVTVAQFIPVGADVVGVALLPEHIVVTDAALGLFVLARPDEGGGRAGFWSQFLRALPYLAFPVVALAVALLPRLATRGVPVSTPAGGPVPSPARRRRA